MINTIPLSSKILYRKAWEPILVFLFSFTLFLKENLIQTEILSRRAIKPKTTKQPTQRGQCSSVPWKYMDILPSATNPREAPKFCFWCHSKWSASIYFQDIMWNSPYLMSTNNFHLLAKSMKMIDCKDELRWMDIKTKSYVVWHRRYKALLEKKWEALAWKETV